MTTAQLDEELAAIVNQESEPIEMGDRETIVIELYRRGTVSSGKAAELLGVLRIDFIRRTSALGIPFIDMTDDEWAREMRVVEAL